MDGYLVETKRLWLLSSTHLLTAKPITSQAAFALELSHSLAHRQKQPLGAGNQSLSQLFSAQPLSAAHGWWSWYLLKKQEQGLPPALVGSLGLMQDQAEDDLLWMGFVIHPEHQKRGYGQEGVEALAQWAFAWPQVRALVAEPSAHHQPSLRLLSQCGFSRQGQGSDPDALRYLRQRQPSPLGE